MFVIAATGYFVPSLDDLRSLLTLIADFPRVRKVRFCDIELEVETSASPNTVNGPSETIDTAGEDDDRRALEDLLYSSGADPNMFLREMRRGS